jgi:hypothetical protein
MPLTYGDYPTTRSDIAKQSVMAPSLKDVTRPSALSTQLGTMASMPNVSAFVGGAPPPTPVVDARIQPQTNPTGLGSYAPAPSLLQGQQQLQHNPQLITHPLGAYTDSQYESDIADLTLSTNRSYQDILDQLGYLDPTTGQVIKGRLEQGADRQRRDIFTGREDVITSVTNAMREAGSLFSGYRMTEQGRQEKPYLTQLGDVETDLSRDLADQFELAMELMQDFEIKRNKALADAARRRAQQPGAGDGGGVAPPGEAPPGSIIDPSTGQPIPAPWGEDYQVGGPYTPYGTGINQPHGTPEPPPVVVPPYEPPWRGGQPY